MFDLDELFMSNPMFTQHKITLQYNRLDGTGLYGFDLWVSTELYNKFIQPVIQDMVDFPISFLGQTWHLDGYSLMINVAGCPDPGLNLRFAKERIRSCGTAGNLRAMPGNPHVEIDYYECQARVSKHGGNCVCLKDLKSKGGSE